VSLTPPPSPRSEPSGEALPGKCLPRGGAAPLRTAQPHAPVQQSDPAYDFELPQPLDRPARLLLAVVRRLHVTFALTDANQPVRGHEIADHDRSPERMNDVNATALAIATVRDMDMDSPQIGRPRLVRGPLETIATCVAEIGTATRLTHGVRVQLPHSGGKYRGCVRRAAAGAACASGALAHPSFVAQPRIAYWIPVEDSRFSFSLVSD
jgi:hypothetical protein